VFVRVCYVIFFVFAVAMSFFGSKPMVRTEPYKPIKTQEPIQLSKLPDGHRFDATHLSPIERDDWPAPPAPAAAYPELRIFSICFCSYLISFIVLLIICIQVTEKQ